MRQICCVRFDCKKKLFYGENIQYAYNFYGTELYPPVWKCMQNLVEHLWWSLFVKITKKLYCRCSTGFFIHFWYRLYSRKPLQNVNIYLIYSKSTSNICHCIAFLFFQLTKHMLVFAFRFFLAADKLNTFRVLN